MAIYELNSGTIDTVRVSRLEGECLLPVYYFQKCETYDSCFGTMTDKNRLVRETDKAVFLFGMESLCDKDSPLCADIDFCLDAIL